MSQFDKNTKLVFELLDDFVENQFHIVLVLASCLNRYEIPEKQAHTLLAIEAQHELIQTILTNYFLGIRLCFKYMEPLNNVLPVMPSLRPSIGLVIHA